MNDWLRIKLVQQHRRELLDDAARQRLVRPSGLRRSRSVRRALARWAVAHGNFWANVGRALERTRS